MLRAEGPLRNHLLASLPAEEMAGIRPHMEPVCLDEHTQLYGPDAPIRYVYFPETTVISLACTLSNGDTVEVGTAGWDGMVGLSVFLADDTSFIQTFTQLPGVAWRIEAQTFAQLARAPGVLRETLLRYAQAYLTQVAQTAVCNATHLVQERCARWLLTTHDRATCDKFPLTHEFLAFMLCVRRSGVTAAMRALRDAGIVQYTRGHMEVLERRKLEGAACECYGIVRANFERLLPGLNSSCAA